MEQIVEDSLRALVNSDLNNPELFFDLLSEIYEDLEKTSDGANWKEFREEFLQRVTIEGMRGPAEDLVEFLDDYGSSDEIEDVRLISRENRRDMLHFFEELVNEDDAPGFDEQVWQDFLTEYSAYWNGRDETWDKFVPFFLHYAEKANVLGPAKELVDEAQDADDKIEVFRGYGIDIEVSDDDDSYDEETWRTFLTTYAALWNGSESSWDDFVTLFLQHAQEQDMFGPANDLVDEAVLSGDKIEVFRDHGIVIEPGDVDLAEVAEALQGVDIEAEWREFLADLAVYWNGLDSTWQPFVDYFLYQAGARIPGLDPDPDRNPIVRWATELVEKVSDAGSAEYKVQVLRDEYGMTVEYDPDPGSFYDFVDKYAVSWDGLEAHWTQFRDWFLHEAREQNIGKYAKLWIDDAERAGPDKSQFVTSYNVQLSPVAPDYALIAVAETVERVVMSSSTIPPEDVQLFVDAFVELAGQMPEVARFSPEDIAQLIEEVTVQT
jgi:hypothetical protein